MDIANAIRRPRLARAPPVQTLSTRHPLEATPVRPSRPLRSNGSSNASLGTRLAAIAATIAAAFRGAPPLLGDAAAAILGRRRERRRRVERHARREQPVVVPAAAFLARSRRRAQALFLNSMGSGAPKPLGCAPSCSRGILARLSKCVILCDCRRPLPADKDRKISQRRPHPQPPPPPKSHTTNCRGRGGRRTRSFLSRFSSSATIHAGSSFLPFFCAAARRRPPPPALGARRPTKHKEGGVRSSLFEPRHTQPLTGRAGVTVRRSERTHLPFAASATVAPLAAAAALVVSRLLSVPARVDPAQIPFLCFALLLRPDVGGPVVAKKL